MGLGAMVAAMFAVAAIVWVNLHHIQAVNAAVQEAREELSADDHVLETLEDQEIGLRGYASTGNPEFLDIYEDGSRQFDLALREVATLTADDSPAVRTAFADVAAKSSSWRVMIALPAIAAVRAGGRRKTDGPASQAMFAAIRADLNIMRRGETAVLVQRQALQRQAFRSSRIALLVGTLLAGIFALAIGGRSFWQLIAARKVAEDAARRLEDALERAHAAERAKTIFLGNMSHEMRTPLNGVAGMAAALATTSLDANQEALLDVIQTSAATLDGLIGDLLTLSRGASASARQEAAFGLGDALRGMTARGRAQAELKGLALRVAVPAEAEVEVIGDAAALDQLLSCLISNAVKFTERGHVAISLLKLGPTSWRFEVADTGIGFDETRKAEMFETFAQSDDSATRRHGGAGLGLALARQLAADLGGRLDAHSTPDEGSTFSFDIDLQPANAVRAAPAEAVADDAPLRILIVDDNATNRKVLELILDQLGVDWVSVEDGQQAVDAARQQDFATILMDIQMPVMDGLTATREIRRLEREARRAPTPVIIVSANGQPEHVQAGRAAGAQLHLTKPVGAEMLVNAISEVLGGPTEVEVAA